MNGFRNENDEKHLSAACGMCACTFALYGVCSAVAHTKDAMIAAYNPIIGRNWELEQGYVVSLVGTLGSWVLAAKLAPPALPLVRCAVYVTAAAAGCSYIFVHGLKWFV